MSALNRPIDPGTPLTPCCGAQWSYVMTDDGKIDHGVCSLCDVPYRPAPDQASAPVSPNPYGSPSDFCTMPEHVAAKKRCTWDKLDAAECYFKNHPGVVVTEPWEDEE